MVTMKLGTLEITGDLNTAPIEIKKKSNEIAMTGRDSVHNFGVQNRRWSLSCWTQTKTAYKTVEDFVKTAVSFTFTDDEGTEHENVSVDSITPTRAPYDYIAYKIELSEDY